MRPLSFLLLVFIFPLTTHASDFVGFKDFFDQSRAPKNMKEVESFLTDLVSCLGFNKSETTFTDQIVLQTLTLRQARGPAFPAQTQRAILLGKAEPIAYPQLSYQQVLTSQELKLVTLKTVTGQNCDFDSDGDIYCNDTYSRQANLELRLRFNGQYLTYSDDTNGVYGYCW